LRLTRMAMENSTGASRGGKELAQGDFTPPLEVTLRPWIPFIGIAIALILVLVVIILRARKRKLPPPPPEPS